MCALPICWVTTSLFVQFLPHYWPTDYTRARLMKDALMPSFRSEERRVGKECVCWKRTSVGLLHLFRLIPSTLLAYGLHSCQIDEGCLNAFLLADLSLSTPTHYSWAKIQSPFGSTLGFAVISGRSFAIDSGKSSLSPNRQILTGVQLQLIYSHLLDCTGYLDAHYHYR